MLGQHASTSNDELYTYSLVLGELLEQAIGIKVGDPWTLVIQNSVWEKKAGNYYININDCKIYKCIKSTNSKEFDENCYELYTISGGTGATGPAGADGKSAYEIAVENGYVGDVTSWLNSLDGRDGVDGRNGVDGQDGAPGTNGRDGAPGTNGIDGVDGAKGADGANGKDGAKGADGANGKSAYEIAKANGTTSATTEADYAQEMVKVKNIKDGSFFSMWKGTTEEHTTDEAGLATGTVCLIVGADGTITMKEKI